mgnify:CR=1 FL=1
MTFGVALDSTVLARTTVPSCNSTPSTTLFFTMICCTGCVEHEMVERKEDRESGGGNIGGEWMKWRERRRVEEESSADGN